MILGKAYMLLLVMWGAGFRIATEPSVTAEPRRPRNHGEPTVTADPRSPSRPRIYVTDAHAREILTRMMGLGSPQAQP